MADKCWSSLKGLAARATRLDACGKPVTGAGAATGSANTCGFIKIDLKANIEAGVEYKVKTAGGVFCINEKDCPQLNWFDVAMEFCQIEPSLYELMSANRLLLNAGGDSVGMAVSGEKKCQGFGLEVWTKIAGDACAAGGGIDYGYFLLPQIVNSILGDFVIENGPVSMTLSGNTKGNPYWNNGPFGGTKPLGTGLALANDHLLITRTPVAPPACTCGYLLAAGYASGYTNQF